jgi:hypothetical protein
MLLGQTMMKEDMKLKGKNQEYCRGGKVNQKEEGRREAVE